MDPYFKKSVWIRIYIQELIRLDVQKESKLNHIEIIELYRLN
jgi:hypothetical protein